jgi:hypothetical protein
VSPLPRPSPDGPQAAAPTAPWLLAVAVASLSGGLLSLVLFGAYVAGVFGVWSYAANPFGVWSYFASVACGGSGVVLGHLARARRALPGSRHAALARTGLVLSYGGTLLALSFEALVYLLVGLAGPSPGP